MEHPTRKITSAFIETMGRLISQAVAYYEHDERNAFADISGAMIAARMLGGLPASAIDLTEERAKEYAELVHCYGALNLEATFVDGFFTDLESLYNVPPEILLEIRGSLPQRFWLLEDRLNIQIADLGFKPQLQKILEEGEIRDVRQLVGHTAEELQLLSDKFRSRSYSYWDDIEKAVNRLGLEFRIPGANAET